MFVCWHGRGLAYIKGQDNIERWAGSLSSSDGSYYKLFTEKEYIYGILHSPGSMILLPVALSMWVCITSAQIWKILKHSTPNFSVIRIMEVVTCEFISFMELLWAKPRALWMTETLSWSLLCYLLWDRILLSCLGRLWDCDFPTSAISVVGLTSLCHQAWLFYYNFVGRHI